MINYKRLGFLKQAAAAVASVALLAPASAYAEDYSSTNIQLFATNKSKADVFNGTGTANENLTVFRAEHYGTWKYGDNYINLDLYNGKRVGGGASGSFGADTNHQMFFVYQPRISLSKSAGLNLGTGFIKDVYLSYRREQASYANFYSNNYGVSFDLAVPGTVFFEQDFMVRHTNLDRDTNWLSRTVWLAPFNAGGIGMHFDGLVLVKSTDNFGTNIFAQPDLLVDVMPKGQMQLGVRLEYARYKNPSGGTYTRTSPYLLAKFYF